MVQKKSKVIKRSKTELANPKPKNDADRLNELVDQINKQGGVKLNS